MIRQVAILLMIGMLAACASSTDGSKEKPKMSDAQAVKIYNASVEPDKQLVCKREKVMGSNRTEKVCRTQSEIKAMRTETREAMDRIRDYGAGSTSGN